MAKRKATKQGTSPGRRVWAARVLPLAFFLAQVLVAPGAFSPYRLPKMAVAVTGIALVVAVGWIVRLSRGKLEVSAGRLVLVLVAYPVLQAVSALWSASPGLALRSSLLSCVWIAGVLWIASLDVVERRRLLRWTAAGAAVSALVALVQTAGMALASQGFGADGDRLDLTGLTGNPADLAMTCVLLLPLLLRRPATILHRWTSWVIPSLLLLAILATQTLTAYAALAAVSFLWAIQLRSRKFWILGTVAAGIIIAGFGWFATTDRFDEQLGRLKRGNWYSFLSARNDGWTAAAQMVREHPALGVGSAHFSHSYYPSRLAWLEDRDEVGRRGELATHFAWAHCDPLQTISELGIAGGLWLAVLAVVLIARGIRGDPLLILGAGAAMPFVILHYPTHVAVGLIPLSLLLAELVHGESETRRFPLRTRWIPATLAVVLAGAALWVIGWQAQIVALDAWRGGMEALLAASERFDDPQRARLGSIIEEQTAARAIRYPAERPWMLRLAGRARLAGGDGVGAETAFRAALSLWPHEEAEFGLGLALAGQNRRDEALLHLARVCRVNPALAKLINDQSLKQSIEMLNRERRLRNR